MYETVAIAASAVSITASARNISYTHSPVGIDLDFELIPGAMLALFSHATKHSLRTNQDAYTTSSSTSATNTGERFHSKNQNQKKLQSQLLCSCTSARAGVR